MEEEWKGGREGHRKQINSGEAITSVRKYQWGGGRGGGGGGAEKYLFYVFLSVTSGSRVSDNCRQATPTNTLRNTRACHA